MEGGEDSIVAQELLSIKVYLFTVNRNEINMSRTRLASGNVTGNPQVITVSTRKPLL
jgi:hypothetical protein